MYLFFLTFVKIMKKFWSSKSTKTRLLKAKNEGFTHNIDENIQNCFWVSGLTHEYIVNLNKDDIMQSKCSCPDYTMNHNICKHIIYVYITEIGDPNSKISSSSKDCCICLDCLYNTVVIVCNECSNEFHSVCISKWNKNCPLCREPL